MLIGGAHRAAAGDLHNLPRRAWWFSVLLLRRPPRQLRHPVRGRRTSRPGSTQPDRSAWPAVPSGLLFSFDTTAPYPPSHTSCLCGAIRWRLDGGGFSESEWAGPHSTRASLFKRGVERWINRVF